MNFDRASIDIRIELALTIFALKRLLLSIYDLYLLLFSTSLQCLEILQQLNIKRTKNRKIVLLATKLCVKYFLTEIIRQ